MKIERLPTPRCLVGEGAVWDERLRALFFIDIIGQNIFRYTPESGEVQSWSTNGHVGALALREGGRAMFGMKNSVFTLDFATSEIIKVAGPAWDRPDITINDGCADGAEDACYSAAARREWMRRSRLADCSLQPTASSHSSTAAHANRMATPSRRTGAPFTAPIALLAMSSPTTIMRRPAPLQTSGCSPIQRRLAARPDGSQVDADGRLWMAIFEGAKVAAFSPDGIVEHVVELPVRLPSSVAFGGPDLDQLYVTSLDPIAMGWPADENGGFTFVVDGLGLRGAVAHRAA